MPPSPHARSSCFYFVVACYRSLRRSKDHRDHAVNELVNKLRFHNASIMNQNGKLPCKMAG